MERWRDGERERESVCGCVVVCVECVCVSVCVRMWGGEVQYCEWPCGVHMCY